MKLTRQLEVEEKRAIAENLSEEELALFDLITWPDLKLTAGERREVRRAVRELFIALKMKKLVVDRRRRQATRAGVRVAVEKAIWQLPARFPDELCQQKNALVYQHVYDNYQSANKNTCTVAAQAATRERTVQ